jgi:NAD(P)-dependent dehydrogenase (short-subunit alcohol dehydrogenase family)
MTVMPTVAVCTATAAVPAISAARQLLTDAPKTPERSMAAPAFHCEHVAQVSDRASWQAAIGLIGQACGRLDILVNSAGVSVGGSIEDTSDENWRMHMSTNLDGVFYGCQSALPLMRRSGEPGSIVNISSVIASRPSGGSGAKRIRWDGSASRTRWRKPRCGWQARRRASRPVQRSQWTAARPSVPEAGTVKSGQQGVPT